MSPSLSVVTVERPRSPGEPKPETVAERVRALQAEAKALANDHVAALANLLLDAAELAAEISSGGDAYLAGARDVARQLVGELENRAETLNAIRARADR